MSLLANNCRRLTSLSSSFLRSPVVSSQFVPHQNASKKYESKKWPGYHVIYSLPDVKRVSLMSRLKLQVTVISGIAIPAVCLMEVNWGLTSAFVHNATFMFGAICFFLHGVGYFSNNVIGIIYAKKDSNDIKIAYMSYFGKRVDIDTTYDDISCPEPKTMFRNPLFSPLVVESQKKKLKLFVQGKIIDSDKFYKLLGVAF
ncbi:transmembrane protein 186 [Diachasma alloeum]|uniref:transmembrane protein 186 n=1 Tax=Diachasma alloeum TaxID=454923 RepID=UPI00073831FF|nr:transmembrane protein 186 [Diachasma alloeum]